MPLLIWGLMSDMPEEFDCSGSTPQNLELEIWKKSFMDSSQRMPSNRGFIGPSCRTGMISKFNYDVRKQTVEVNSEEFSENSGSTAMPMEKNFRDGPI